MTYGCGGAESKRVLDGGKRRTKHTLARADLSEDFALVVRVAKL